MIKPLTRLALAVLAGLLASGCSPGSPAAPPTPTAIVFGPSSISIAVTSNDFGPGAPRVPFVLFEGASPLADARAVKIIAFDLASGTPTPGWSGEATPYTDYDPPYWTVYPELPHAGFWGLGAVITLADGTQTQGQFAIEVLADPSAPEIGEPAPASANRTLASEPDLAKLTSDPAPEPGLYQLTVAEALESRKPAVVTFATPAFCESRLCAPVVDSVKSVYRDLKDEANFVHVEVYKTFDPLVHADEMAEWGLTSEPWTFVLDADGKVAARLGGPVSPRELHLVLDPLLIP